MSPHRNVRGTALALAAACALAPLARAAAQQRSAYEELQTFSQVLNYIRANYADSVTYSVLVKAAIDGMLHALDPHSQFFSRLDYERLNALERGELAATGIHLESVDGVPTVLGIAPKSSAEKSGVQRGDRIVALNDTVVAGLDLETIRLRLAGEKGSKVRVTLARGLRFEPETLSVTLKREIVEPHFVSDARLADPTTGYIRLEEFGGKSAEEVHAALKRLTGQGAQQVILDLRGNPGGLVDMAVELVSEFMPKHTVVFTSRGRKRDVDTTYVTQRDGDFRDLPLIVLIDGWSASAAEATAASLQDHDRALLVGRRSFGKALEQVDFPLASGEDLHLTIGYIVSPSGRVIQRRYQGLAIEQYYSLAGKGGAAQDTAEVFHTDAGRPVRGGGGLLPDIVVPGIASQPVWWSAADDSDFDAAVADSVALTLPATPAARAAWLNSPAEWKAKLVPPFLARVRARFHVAAEVDSTLEFQIAATLAREVADVRWGPDAAAEFTVRHSADVRAALTAFPRLPELLAAPKH
ncbi:MAG TPA: S41 family peptidase [Gemmatimonadales bacterium]